MIARSSPVATQAFAGEALDTDYLPVHNLPVFFVLFVDNFFQTSHKVSHKGHKEHKELIVRAETARQGGLTDDEATG
jgi:hypothetical protein